MNIEQLISQLNDFCTGCNFEIFQDDVLMANARIGAEHYKIGLDFCTPSFVLKVDKSFIVVIVQGSRKLDFRKLKSYLGTNKVSMANPEEISKITAAPIGSVSMINPQLRTLIDQNITTIEYCFGGCGIEKFTLKITAHDLIKVTNAEVGDFSASRST
jgi:prolyl-tRNA editing enzyme YbaK/EbsC (Cys-tRNA(Pro) deacylase)